jgi:hypothetical protein
MWSKRRHRRVLDPSTYPANAMNPRHHARSRQAAGLAQIIHRYQNK